VPVKENTRPTTDHSLFTISPTVPTSTRAGKKLVDASIACATIQAGVADARMAWKGGIVIGASRGPSGVVCHGTEIVSAVEQVEIRQTRDLVELGGNGAGEMISIKAPG